MGLYSIFTIVNAILTLSFLWTFYLDFSITYLFLPTIFITYPFTIQSCQILFVMKRSRKYLFSNTILVIFLEHETHCTCAFELIPFLWRAIIVTTTNGLVIIKVYFI